MLLSISLVLALSAQSQQADSDPLAEAVRTQADNYQMVRPSPMIHFSPTRATAYALGNGCVPAVMIGRPATEYFQTAAIRSLPEREGLHQVSTRVTLLQTGNSCTVTATGGDPEDLRASVLETLDGLNVIRSVRSDTGPGSRDSNGNFRQELHCLTLNGEALFLVMSTSSASNRARLMASLGRDSGARCVQPSGG